MTQNAMTSILRARTALILGSPFFAHLCMMLKIKEVTDGSVPTAATDGDYIYYEPVWISKLKDAEVKAVMMHEVLHVVMMHMLRRGSRDHYIWNMACDYAINPIIKDLPNHPLPAGALYRHDFAGKSAEFIYDKLMEEKTNAPPEDTWSLGGVIDHPQSGTATAQEVEQQWKQTIASAVMTGRMTGSLPQGLDRYIDKLMNPKLPWQELLQAFISNNARNDYRFQKPNKRYAHAGLYLPSLDTPELGLIGVIIDTSGSVNNKQLNVFASELAATLSLYPGSEAEVMYVDHALEAHEHVTADDIRLDGLKAKGGGGTSFVPGFEYMKEEGIEPVLTVYFTDGYCNDFPEAPDHPVLWVIYSGDDSFKAPFGEVVVM